MLNWEYADGYGELPLNDAMKVEALVVIAQQLAHLTEQMERLNEKLTRLDCYQS